MIKVCFINIYQGTSLRGAETFVAKLSEKLSGNFDVRVIAGGKIPLARWPFLWRAFLDPQGIQILVYSLSLLSKLWREKYDVIIPVNGGWMPAVIRLITWVYGGKMIISGQSGMGWDERNNLWCFPDIFVALSEKAKKWAKRANPFVKIVKIPNGVDVYEFTPFGPKVKVALKKPIVLCVAALTKRKRIDLVIRAVAKVKSFSLLLAGQTGESRDEIISLGKKLLGKRFLYTNISHSKMPDLFRGCDIFTLVSEAYFSFEIAIVEAMATGLPVVVNDDDIRREIVGRYGNYVNPHDIESYAKALEKAYANSVTPNQDLVKRAKSFSWKNISSKYSDLIKSLRQ